MTIYTQHRENLERYADSSKQLTYDNSTSSGDIRQSQEDIASILKTYGTMAHLMTFFVEPESDMRRATKLWKRLPLNSIAGIGFMQWDTDVEVRTD